MDESEILRKAWETLPLESKIWLTEEVERKAAPPPPGPSFHQRARAVLAFDAELRKPPDQPFVLLPAWLGRPPRKEG
jgi:hypothetical protein